MKVLQVFEPYGGFNVHKQDPQGHGGQTDSSLCVQADHKQPSALLKPGRWKFDASTRAVQTAGRRLARSKNVGLTCVPDILDPHVGAGGKKQPLDGDEEKADDV